LIFKPPLYSMNPSFRNLFMKKFTRERKVVVVQHRNDRLFSGVRQHGQLYRTARDVHHAARSVP
jgi:hypothetical protein